LKPFHKNYLYAALGLLILIDLWVVDKRYLNDKNYVSKSMMETPYAPSKADEQILKDTDPHYRVINVSLSPFQDASTSYFHKSIGGYHGAKLRRYQDLYERQISKNNMQVLNMLNAKYFIIQNQQTNEPMAQRNPGALGNAWFVKQLKWVANPDSEINALSNFDPASTAIIDQKWEKEVSEKSFSYDSTASISLKSYKADELAYATRSSSAQMTVFSEIFYPLGWNAYVDGKLTPHFGVNYVLRAMIVPAGQHEVVFKFEPESYYKGEKIALAGSILLFLFVLGGVWMQSRKVEEQ
jgi:hypothetical protein